MLGVLSAVHAGLSAGRKKSTWKLGNEKAKPGGPGAQPPGCEVFTSWAQGRDRGRGARPACRAPPRLSEVRPGAHRERRALPGRSLAGGSPVGPLLGIAQGAARGRIRGLCLGLGAWAEGPSRWLFPHLPVVPALQAHPTPCHTGMGALGKSVSPSQSGESPLLPAAVCCLMKGGERGPAWPPGLRSQRAPLGFLGPRNRVGRPPNPASQPEGS